MELHYASNYLKKLCTSERVAIKKLGERCARTLFRRISQMESAEDLATLTQQAGHFHPLTADRKGQWACRLQGGLRLIFVPDACGEMLLKEIIDPASLTIIEIKDYHH